MSGLQNVRKSESASCYRRVFVSVASQDTPASQCSLASLRSGEEAAHVEEKMHGIRCIASRNDVLFFVVLARFSLLCIRIFFMHDVTVCVCVCARCLSAMHAYLGVCVCVCSVRGCVCVLGVSVNIRVSGYSDFRISGYPEALIFVCGPVLSRFVRRRSGVNHS